MLCWFLHTTMHISHKDTYISFLSSLPPTHLPISPSRSSQSPELVPLCYTAGSHYYLTHGSVYTYLSPHLPVCPNSPSPTVSTSLFSKSASLFLPCKQVHWYHFARFHMYALIYDTCFYLSDLFHSV